MNTQLDTLACPDCGLTVPRRTSRQRYCKPCSAARDRIRKSRWAREHPQSAAATAPARSRRQQRSRLKGLETSLSTPSRRGLNPALLWEAEIVIPFSYFASKNHVWTYSGSHVYSRQESADYRKVLAEKVRQAVAGRAVAGRLWLDIFVQKPNHRGDAVNVVDLVCDAVEDATGVDDRWFSVRRLDWEVKKSDPLLYVVIGQETSEEQRICALCGRELPTTMFGPHGKSVGRECRNCRRTRDPIPG